MYGLFKFTFTFTHPLKPPMSSTQIQTIQIESLRKTTRALQLGFRGIVGITSAMPVI